MSFKVQKAKRSRRPLKINMEGTSGSGKTFSALRTAFAMIRAGIGKRVVVADSENESASLYAGIDKDGAKWEYEVCPIPPDKQNPVGYTECYNFLVSQGFDIIIIDSMTHAWAGALQRVDDLAARSRSGDKFSIGWKTVTPEQETLFKTITDTRAHVITTTRVKTEYDKVTQASGKEGWGKVGTKAVQRAETEYEYDVVIRFNNETGEHLAVVEKVRGCTAMDGKSAKCPGPDFWKPLFDWWKEGEDVVPTATPASTPPAPSQVVTNEKPHVVQQPAANGSAYLDTITQLKECRTVGEVDALRAAAGVLFQQGRISQDEGVQLKQAFEDKKVRIREVEAMAGQDVPR